MDTNYTPSDECSPELYTYLKESGFIDDDEGVVLLTTDGLLAVGYTKKDVQDLYSGEDDECGLDETYCDQSYEELTDEELEF